MDFFIEWLVGVIVAFLIGTCIYGVVWMIQQDEKTQNFNNRFSVSCIKEGGVPVINDKDMCLKDGKVLFYEH